MNESPSRNSRPAAMAPWPILSNWPVSRVPEYAYEVIERRHVASRSCLALRVQPVDDEIWPDPKAYLFVSFDLPEHRKLSRLVQPELLRAVANDSRSMEIPGKGTLRELFANMEWKGATAWRLPLSEVGIEMLFLRMDVSDPQLKPFMTFNRPGAASKDYR